MARRPSSLARIAVSISGSAANVGARILASARRGVFAADIPEVDIGQGMVTAPE